ncbi:hypothetical protein BH20ACT14_BH20ACT14_16220 [soil metagenome]|nr:type II toxin-antitoxin system Phd/YefM family antitoxin [Actinomycetota bacterium]
MSGHLGTTRKDSLLAEIDVNSSGRPLLAVIEEVEGGAAYVVTKRDRPAAVLMPIQKVEDLMASTVAGGGR